jgi:GNAT superfamily N-acetyltransferase
MALAAPAGWQRAVGELGWRDAALYALARAIERVTRGRAGLRKYYFVAQPVPDRPTLPPHRGASIAVRRIDERHPAVPRFPRPPQVIERRFRDGALCFLAEKGSDFVGFLWLQPASYLEDEVRSRFTPTPAGRSIWDFDVHVEPAHRASLAFARLWDHANAFLRNEGIAWSVSRISAFNPGSLNAHARLGARPLASACYLYGRRWQLMLADIAPRMHFSAGPASIPELRLDASRARAMRYRRFAARQRISGV